MTAAIIQARMTSTRLPGKVLKPIMGKPMLSYMIERLRFCKYLDAIIIATTTNAEDEPIVAFSESESLPFYRGSEEDVLDRYYQTARTFGVEHILRVTSDCPLVDPALCDRVIETYRKEGVDFVHTGPTFAEGLDCEIFSFKALVRAWREAGLKSEREHMTLYLHNHPELFRKTTLINETDDSGYRFTVDEEADYLVVKAIFEGLYRPGRSPFSAQDIKMFLDDHPSLFSLNTRIVRNEGLIISLRDDRPVADASMKQPNRGGKENR
jgi:spore coat polysaccharide biosynthesis protein SpsF (cytidylyltransferase family)